jgi:hypothetical protein
MRAVQDTVARTQFSQEPLHIDIRHIRKSKTSSMRLQYCNCI